MKPTLPARASSRALLSVCPLLFAALILLTLLAARSPLYLSSLSRTIPVVPTLVFLATTAVAAGCLFRLRKALRDYQATRQENARFLAAAESSLDDFYIFDGVMDPAGAVVDFRFSYLNPNAERRLNTRRENLIGKVLSEVLPFATSSGLIEKYVDVVRTGIPFTTEVFIDDDRIKATWIHLQVVKLGNGIAITSRDVTERKRLIDHISYLAHYDQLTGVANRTLLYELLQKEIHNARQLNQEIAIFLVDIDHFKHINDTLGHAEGDSVLKAIARRLRSVVGTTDTIARIGGDEFVILIPEFNSAEDLLRLGQQIVHAAAKPITIGHAVSIDVTITISMGLSIYPNDGLDANELLRSADHAMYAVKQNGRNGLHPFKHRATPDPSDSFIFPDDTYAAHSHGTAEEKLSTIAAPPPYKPLTSQVAGSYWAAKSHPAGLASRQRAAAKDTAARRSKAAPLS